MKYPQFRVFPILKLLINLLTVNPNQSTQAFSLNFGLTFCIIEPVFAPAPSELLSPMLTLIMVSQNWIAWALFTIAVCHIFVEITMLLVFLLNAYLGKKGTKYFQALINQHGSIIYTWFERALIGCMLIVYSELFLYAAYWQWAIPLLNSLLILTFIFSIFIIKKRWK